MRSARQKKSQVHKKRRKRIGHHRRELMQRAKLVEMLQSISVTMLMLAFFMDGTCNLFGVTKIKKCIESEKI